MVNGKMVNNMEKVFTHLKMEQPKKVFGKKVSFFTQKKLKKIIQN